MKESRRDWKCMIEFQSNLICKSKNHYTLGHSSICILSCAISNKYCLSTWHDLQRVASVENQQNTQANRTNKKKETHTYSNTNSPKQHHRAICGILLNRYFPQINPANHSTGLYQMHNQINFQPSFGIFRMYFIELSNGCECVYVVGSGKPLSMLKSLIESRTEGLWKRKGQHSKKL